MHKPDSSQWHDGTFERFIRLQSYNLLKISVDISVLVTDNSGDGMFVNVIHATSLAFNLEKSLEFFPQFFCPYSGSCKEGVISVITSVVLRDVHSRIDFVICIFTHSISPFCTFSYTSDSIEIP